MEPGMTSKTQAQHLSKLISDKTHSLVMPWIQVCNMYCRIQCQMLTRLLIEPNVHARAGSRVLELMATMREKGVAAQVGNNPGSSSTRPVMKGTGKQPVFRVMPVFSGVALVQSCRSLGITRGPAIPSAELDMIPYVNVPLEFPPSCTGSRGWAILSQFN